MLNLSEIFYSIQGESTYAGLPCIFIRFAGCNLRCNYCDTSYAYETNFTKNVNDVLKIIKKYEPLKLVEITGGEPLLQEEVYGLIELLHERKYKILLETNGSINLQNVPKYVTKIVDVKCPESGEKNSFFWENLKFINPEKDEIKFVISSKKDYEWSKKIIKKKMLSEHKIIFSAVTDKLKMQVLADWIVADKLPIRFQLQLHKQIWGDKKEV